MTFTGPSVILVPENKTVLSGRAAAAELSRSRVDADAALSQGKIGWGLLMVHSHRQRAAEYEQHAHMLNLIYGVLPGHRLLHEASLLIVSNNAGGLAAEHEDPLHWLVLYTIPLRLRMLIVTNVNLGYLCGELQSLVSAWEVMSRFPWVLYSSGPDVMPTPAGVRDMNSYLMNHSTISRNSTGVAADLPAIFFNHFPGPPNATVRISMDQFIFYPSRSQSVWPKAAAACIHGKCIPETCLGDVIAGDQVPHIWLWRQGYQWGGSKEVTTQPRGYEERADVASGYSSSWHSHNISNTRAWIVAQERAHNLVPYDKPRWHHSHYWRVQSD